MKSVYILTLRSLMRELKTYIFLAIMLLAEGFFLTYINFNTGYSATEYSLEFIEIALILTLPLITAELFVRDRISGFEKMTFSLGAAKSSLFFGKTVALVTVFSALLLPLVIAPIIFETFGTVNLTAAFASLTTYFITGLSFISVCVFVSVTVKSRTYSYVISYVSLLLIYLFGVFSDLVPVKRSFSLLILSVIAIALATVIYLFTRSGLTFGAFFCITEALLILFYFVIPKPFAGALRAFFDILSPCSSLNAVIYGAFDIAAVMHIILFTAVFTSLSLVQLHRRKYE